MTIQTATVAPEAKEVKSVAAAKAKAAPAKPQSKPASAAQGKKAAPAKAAPKGDKKGAQKPAKAVAAKGANFFISCGRPSAGALLHAHTEALFQIYGMHQGKGIPLAVAKRVMGDSAVNYHKVNARFEVRDGHVFLTPAGKAHFAARIEPIDQAKVKAYVSIMTLGKPDGELVKNADFIAKIA